MARRLTDDERASLDYLKGALAQVVEPSQKNKAAAVASALVRVPGNVITEEDLARILKRAGRDRAALEAAVREVALDVAPGEEAGYVLRIPEGLPPVPAPLPASADEPVEAEAVAEEGQVVSAETSAEDDAEDDGDLDFQGEAEAGDEADEAEDVPEGEAYEGEADAADAAEAEAAEGDAAETTDETDAEPASDGTSDAASSQPASSEGDGRKPGRRSRRTRGGTRRTKKATPSRPQQLSEVPYVRRGGPAEMEVRARILELDQRFWMNGWLLSHPGAYSLYERELTSINDALVNGALPGDITRRQLAYQMGGDEKFFEYGADGHKLLRAMGMEDLVRHRPMPKPDLLYHAPRRRKHMRVLVTENLDPWLDVHDLMYEEGRGTILGERIHAVVLGGGTPVLEHNRLALLLDTLRADSVEVLYWGDIDRAGIDIMVRLRDVLGEAYPFKPFTPAYQLMVDKAMERYPDPLDNEQTGQMNLGMPDMSMVCEGLSDEAAAYARSVVEACRLVPQEILTRRDL